MAKPGRPRAHSHDEIVQAALSLGINTFSMPALGRRLGMAHSAIYRYFEIRDEIVEDAIAWVLVSASSPSADQPWDEMLRAIGESTWAICETYVGFDRAARDHQWPADDQTALYVAGLQAQGFTEDDAVIAVDLVKTVAVTSHAKPPTALIGARRLYELELNLVLDGLGNLVLNGVGRPGRAS